MVKFNEKMIAEGHCDNRGAAFCATATELPNGEYGIVALCVNGNKLNLYDVDMKNNIGELLYEVSLNQIEDLKIKSGILAQVLKFKFAGSVYSFKNFMGVKPALKVIEEESQNK